MANASHLRFTPAPLNSFGSPPVATYDLSGFAALYDKIIIAHEIATLQEASHYHIWIEHDSSEATIVNHAKKYLNIPKSGRGKGNAYYCHKFNAYTNPSPAYICADGDIRLCKGYTQDAIAEYIADGKKRFAPKPKLEGNTIIYNVAVTNPPAPKKTSQWDLLFLWYEDLYAQNENHVHTVPQICALINQRELQALRALPRFNDTARYAVSLNAIFSQRESGENEEIFYASYLKKLGDRHQNNILL